MRSFLGEPLSGVLRALVAGACGPLVAGGRHAGGTEHRGLSPAALLIDDGNAAVLATAVTLLYMAATSYSLGFPSGALVFDIAVVAVLWVLLPTAAVMTSAWGQFCVARAVLFASHKTPLRLMSFLNEAHDRGVLRQSGGLYQFRHNLLQDHLANHQ
jgi:hypothetical protein